MSCLPRSRASPARHRGVRGAVVPTLGILERMGTLGPETKLVLKRLSEKAYETSEERDELLGMVLAADGLQARDVVFLLFRPDRALRDTGTTILKRLAEADTADLVIAACKGKPDAAVRAASAVLVSLGVPVIEARLSHLLTGGKPDVQETVRRILLDAPVSATLEPLLWQLATSGRTEDRLTCLLRLGSGTVDAATAPRWFRLARDPEKAIREKALEVLARTLPSTGVDLFVEQLPLVGYATQQVLVEALTQVSVGQGVAFADRILPLMAAGDPGTRSAVLKILLGMDNRRELIKRYIVFSKTLAGWARDRALDSMRSLGADLIEPTIELLSDPDEDVRAAALLVASSFEDPRIVPATIGLLEDPDWWIRISAAETLGRLRDPRAVPALVNLLSDGEARWSAVEALGRLGDLRALPALASMLGDPAPDVRVEVIQALSGFSHPAALEVVRRVAAEDPSRPVRVRALDAAVKMARAANTALPDEDALKREVLAAKIGQGEPRINGMLVATRNKQGSDLHIAVGQPPIVRLAADLLRVHAEPLTAEQTDACLHEILTDSQWQRLQREYQLDFCHFIPNAGRYRGNVFIDQHGVNAVFRVIPERPPTIADIGLPPHLAEIASFHQGLVLVCGPSGSGKSTTLAALVDLFNETRHDHIITMEDPVEFVHPFKHCLINQREVGSATESFARALRAALREDPDVIVIGELRDSESVLLALTAAETGHVVLGTLNSTTAPKAIDRVISSFPVDQQSQVRTSLSESLRYVIAQRLVASKEPHKLVACFEVLKCTMSVSNLIRDEKTILIPSLMQMGRSHGMQTFDHALKALLSAGRISPETAYLAASKKEDFEVFVSSAFLEGRKG